MEPGGHILIALGLLSLTALVVVGYLISIPLLRNKDVARSFADWHEDVFPALLREGRDRLETGSGGDGYRAGSGPGVTRITNEGIARPHNGAVTK